MSVTISRLAASVKPSATLAAGARAARLRANGVQVFDLGLGEPDFATPDHICRAAYDAMQAGHTHYTPAAGLAELRSLLASHYQQSYGLPLVPEQVMLCNGAKHGLHNALTAMVGPGDDVIIPTPYWVSYSDLVEMVGASCRLVETTPETNFKMTPGQLKAALTPRSKLLILNSPCNPTGTVYTRAELEALADVVLDAGIAVVSDEIYERLVFDGGSGTCFATLRPELFERTVTISGFSKSYAMTGWRLGWAAAPAPLIQAMTAVQSQEAGSPSTIAQYAGMAALRGDQSCVEKMRREFELRRDLVCARLDRIPGVRYRRPHGAFYAFFDISEYLGRTFGGQCANDSDCFCLAALELAHVNVVPGSAFGVEGYVRLSFAASRPQIEGGFDSLERLFAGAGPAR